VTCGVEAHVNDGLCFGELYLFRVFFFGVLKGFGNVRRHATFRRVDIHIYVLIFLFFFF